MGKKVKTKYHISEMIERSKRQVSFISFIYRFSSKITEIKFLNKALTAYRKTLDDGVVTPKQIFQMYKNFLKKINSKESKLKKRLVILQLTIRDCFIFYFKLIWQSGLILVIMTLIISFVIFIGFLLWSLFKYIALCITTFSQGVSKDAWLEFWGSVTGSIVTVLGILLTLRYERKRDENNNIRQARPIIVLRECNDVFSEQDKEIHPSCTITFASILTSDNELIKLDCPYIYIENIGYNAALNTEIDIHVSNMGYATYCGVGSIDAKKVEKYGFSVSFIPACLPLFKRFNEKGKDKHIPLADILTMRMFFGLEIDDIQMVACSDGEMKVTFHDIWGVYYEQMHHASVYIAKAKEKYYAAIGFQEFSIGKVLSSPKKIKL